MRHPAAKLYTSQVTEIRQKLAAGISQYALARRYGVSQATISNIKRDRFWKNHTNHLQLELVGMLHQT